MADSFFGFDTTLSDHSEEALDCLLEDDDLGEEEEYDALNDETFGSEASIGDWEKDHEKLAEITESSRPHNQNSSKKKNGVNDDIENSLSHLVLDEKEGITPRPGVWDSPNLAVSSKFRSPSVSLPSALKNVCTVEELERGLFASRPPPGLDLSTAAQPQQHVQQQQQQQPQQPQQPQQQYKSDGSVFEALSLNDKLQINGLPPPRFPPGLGLSGPHPVVIPPNMRIPHPQFIQHPRLLPNQPGNVLRYMPPHLMLSHSSQRQQLHGSFCGNFPQPPHPNLGPPLFLRPDHPMVPAFSSNQNNHQQQQTQQPQQQHSFPFPGNQSNHQQQQQQQHHHHPFPYSGNQRTQNRPFHHGEQTGTHHHPFFKNNQYMHRNYDPANQRHYHYQHHPQGINGLSSSGEYDEYAGLMSSREKQWLINIQLLQLNTNQPYVDDYYYTVFCDRQNKQNTNQDQKDKKYQNNNGYHRDTRDKDQPQPVPSKVVYTPTQFENSLGKLQCGSVTAPRKIIDMDVVPNSDPQSAHQTQQKDTKKTRQLLLEIESLYTIQLKLEDLSNPLAILSEQQQQQQQQPDGEDEAVSVVKRTGPDLIGTILTSLLQLVHDDKLATMLSIRKGKTLLLRFLPYLNATVYTVQLTELWSGLLRGLAVIGRRDSHLLVNFYPEFQRWLRTVQSFSTILQLGKAFSESANQPAKSNSLAFALRNKFGVSVVATLLERAEELCDSTSDESLSAEWSTFLLAIVEIIGDSAPRVSPCQPVAGSTLKQHLNRITTVTIERYSVLEFLLTHANPSR